MLAILSESVVWWHWVIVGVVLILAEMSMGTFLFLGIGLAAMVVGGVDYAFHTSFLSELLTWTALSILALAAWVRWFKEPKIVTTGQSDHGLDTEGTVSVAIEPHRRGKVMFDTPVLGNTLWHASSGESIPKGTRVHIVEINGQLIEVTPIKEV